MGNQAEEKRPDEKRPDEKRPDEKRQGEKQTQDHPSDGKTPERFIGSEKMYGETMSETVEIDHLMERRHQGESGGDDGPRRTDSGGAQGDQPGAHSAEKHDPKKEGGKQEGGKQ